MTSKEFKEWFDYFSFRLPSMRTWLDRMKPDVRDGMLALWEKDLESVSADNAARAVDGIYNGTIQEPKPWDRLPATVRHYHGARTPSGPTVIDGVQTYRCLPCQDSGIICVWTIGTQLRAISGNFARLNTRAVGCCFCTKGEAHEVRYDPEIMAHSDYLGDLTGEERLRQWALDNTEVVRWCSGAEG